MFSLIDAYPTSTNEVVKCATMSIVVIFIASLIVFCNIMRNTKKTMLGFIGEILHG